MPRGRANIYISSTSQPSCSTASRPPRFPRADVGTEPRGEVVSSPALGPGQPQLHRGVPGGRGAAPGGGRSRGPRPPPPHSPASFVNSARAPCAYSRLAAASTGCACALQRGEGRRGRESVTDSGRGRGGGQRRRLFRHEAAAPWGWAVAVAAAAAASLAPLGGCPRPTSRAGVAGEGSAAEPRTGRRLRGPRPAFSAGRLPGPWHPRLLGRPRERAGGGGSSPL